MNKITNNQLSVHFIGGEGINWALDEALRAAQVCMPNSVKSADFEQADVIYSVWPGALETLDPARLNGKLVICEFDNPPYHWVKQTSFLKTRRLVSLWVTLSSEAMHQAMKLGMDALLVPHCLNGYTFFPREANCAEVRVLRERYAIPTDQYVIGNFHRDSEGVNLQFPELQKGPDVFLQIVLALFKKKYPVHVLLAGPRRHWLRSQLQTYGIPYTFVGKMIEEDDIDLNILPRQELNDLYACLNLVLITSRWEGGLNSVLEAAATQRKVLSSRVGLAEDVLDLESIFDHPDQAIEIIEKDILRDFLSGTIAVQYDRYMHSFTFAQKQEAMVRVFQQCREMPVLANAHAMGGVPCNRPPSSLRRLIRRLGLGKDLYSKKTVSMLREFHKPPYGGGNQFMLALKIEFEKMGVRVLNNVIGSHVDGYLFDSLWFDLKLLNKLGKLSNPRVGHRIDGPIHLYRGNDKNLDDQIFEINRQFATVSIIQSVYTMRSIIASGYSPIAPIVIPNSVNPDIFFKKDKSPSPRKKIQLVSTSWSDNPMKGVNDYKWIDENLDFSRYSYTFFGRISANFSNIVVKPPLPSLELANALREHDLYITASRNDPCSNALLEALACGLPALYINSGGHPELVGFGGLPYDNVEEIPAKLERLVLNYSLFSGCLRVTPMSLIAKRYLDAVFSNETI